MGLFGKKNKVEPIPVEDAPPLPTLETLNQKNPEVQQEAKAAEPQFPPVNFDMFNQPKPAKSLQPANVQPARKFEPRPRGKIEDRPVFAPLFVKIDRYRNILNALGQLRTSIVMIRNSFATLNELEKARSETLSLIEEAVSKLENKIMVLDSELLRPAGQYTETTPEYQDVETVQATVADLKGQIQQLKTELEKMN